MNYTTKKIFETDEDIELIKTAVESGTFTLLPARQEINKFTIDIYNIPPLQKDSKIIKSYTYDLFDFIPLSVFGASIKDAVDIIYSESVGYKAYLKNIGIFYSFLLYYTNFPAYKFTFEELDALTSASSDKDIIFVLSGITNNSSKRGYGEKLVCAVEEQILHDEQVRNKNITTSQSELSKLIDKVIELSGINENPEQIVEIFKKTVPTMITNTLENTVD